MEHSIFPLGLLLPHGPTFRAEGLFPPLQELTAAHTAILRLDPLELRAAVAVCTTGCAALDGVPMLAHEPLPVRVITQIVHPLAKQRIQNREILPHLCPGSGEIKSLPHGWLRSAEAPRPVLQHSAYFVGILGQICKIDLSTDGLLRAPNDLADHWIAVTMPDAVSQSLVVRVRPHARLSMIVRTDWPLLQAEVIASARNRTFGATQDLR